jgi:CheY-like chemotaxis protein/anti-sigma regulatory factor (Ser/Thr protein kinase)
MLGLALSRRGYQAACAAGGEEAVRLLRKRPFDIMVTDIHMPDMNGLALCEVARGIRPGIGVVLITGFQTEDSVLRAFGDGASAYLRKPLNLQTLYRTLQLVAENLPTTPAANVRVEIGRPSAEAARMLGLETDDEGWITFEAPSHRDFLERFANLCELLIERGLDSDVTEELRVAILELGSNAIEWGHRSDENKLIRMSARLLPDKLVIVIEDEGPGFRLEDVPDPTRDARAFQRARRAAGKRPGGYGIALVRALTTHLIYNERGNLVAMVKDLRARPSSG